MSNENGLYTQWLPVDLCNYVFQNKLFRMFQVYICLKHRYSGIVRRNEIDYKGVAEIIRVRSERTVRLHIAELIKKEWVAEDKITKTLYFRNIARICSQNSINSSRYSAEFDMRDIYRVKAFVCGVILWRLWFYQKRKHSLELKEGSSLPSKCLSDATNIHYPIACNAIAQYYGISNSTAHRYRKMACDEGFAKIKADLTYTNIPATQRKLVEKAFEEFNGRIRIHKGWVMIRNADLIYPRVRVVKTNTKGKKWNNNT